MSRPITNRRKTGKIRENFPIAPKNKYAALKDMALLLSSAVLFSASFPNPISEYGFYPLGFIALFPIFIVINRANWSRIFLYGFGYALVTYTLFNFWLIKFHPLTIFFVPVIYAVYFVLLFPLLKLALFLFPRYGYLVQGIIWVGYEYLRTKGFLGYSYGILGYSQYLFIPFIQIASITGVWGVSFLTLCPSLFIGNALRQGTSNILVFLRKNVIVLVAYVIVMIGVLVYGSVNRQDGYGEYRQWKVALIQHNIDPWKSGVDPYRNNMEKLIRLSKQAVEENPEIVIWSETAFVPAIDWHSRYRTNHESYYIVADLLDFLSTQSVPYLIGNDDGQLATLPDGSRGRVDYNATLLYENGEIKEIYRKIHLVPFTEHFPFQKLLPWLYNWLREADTHFWEKGKEYVVFKSNGVRFSTPICFEDTFGYLSRNFARAGADVIVNVTNDSWSKSVAAEMQHMAMAVFRAVENKRSVVRATNGGITCTINPDGRIISKLDPFIEDYLISSVPVYTKKETFYFKHGDVLGQGMVGTSIVLLVLGVLVIGLKRKI